MKNDKLQTEATIEANESEEPPLVEPEQATQANSNKKTHREKNFSPSATKPKLSENNIFQG